MPVEIAFDVRNELGEGPVFDQRTAELIWFDILGQEMFFGRPETGRFTSVLFDEPVSAAFLDESGEIFVAGASGLYQLERPDRSYKLIFPIEAENILTRANDSRSCPGGAVWFGTMGRALEPEAGAIYHLARDRAGFRLSPLYAPLSIPNATCFSPDGRTGYFCDTPKQAILKVALDPQTGLPRGTPQLFVDLSSEMLQPDGAAVDEEGCVWNAQWGAGRVACYGPDGRFRQAVSLPASQITCPCFGGPAMKTLFVTSAKEGLRKGMEPLAGAVFAIEMPVRGLAEQRCRFSRPL